MHSFVMFNLSIADKTIFLVPYNKKQKIYT